MPLSLAAATRGFVCSVCRSATSACPKPSRLAPTSALSTARPCIGSACAFTTALPRRIEHPNHPAGGHEISVPWYLRTPASVPSPVQTAHVPDLPPNPPPLLQPILHYLAVTAGLDDLALLDLRHLDPPPALGSKLIMILGTARSEKHLHVAADRFCRHLRRDHGLKANAAGLLGRNELKIKLRRKAKRMRMLANVGGAAPMENLDDGIRTGWICCTLATIDAHPEDRHVPGELGEAFVGFRDVQPGVNVVVQMFTEEKRAETDLETLWGGVLKTHRRRDGGVDEKVQQGEEDVENLVDDDVLLQEAEEDVKKLVDDVLLQEAEEDVEKLVDDDDNNNNVLSQQPAMERELPRRPLFPASPSQQPRRSPGDVFPPMCDADAERQGQRRSRYRQEAR